MNFPLHPDTPAEGVALEQLFGGGPAAQARLAASSQRLGAIAQAEGLPMSSERTMTYNSRLAQELGAWATARGQGPRFHAATFRAYFADRRNISEPDVLVAIAGAVGLDASEAREVLQTRSHREIVDSEWQQSRAAGVDAVPTFICGDQRVVGAQAYEVLAALVERAGAIRVDRP